MNMNYRVFISHATANLRLAKDLSALIRRLCPNADVFIAECSVPAGTDLAFNIFKALINADVVVLFWTPLSQLSNWVKLEGEYSYVLRKHLIQVMTEKNIPISKTLRTLKYEEAYQYKSVDACLNNVATQIAKLANKQTFLRSLIRMAERSQYSFLRDDNAFYTFAINTLKKKDCTDALFITGSPVIVLPSEVTTYARMEYLNQVHSRFTRRGELGFARYVFDKTRTFARLDSRSGEADKLRGHLRFMLPLLESSSFKLQAAQDLHFVPSGLITQKEGAIILKDPSEPDRTVGVYFVKGRQLNYITIALRNIVDSLCVESESVWFPEIEQRLSRKGKKA